MTLINLNDHRQGAAAAPRPLPANVDAEQAVLGAILLNNTVFHSLPQLDAEHFSEDLHRQIFTVMADLIKEGRAATVVTVKTFLSDQELAPDVTVATYLVRLAREASGGLVTIDYARTVTELHARRKLIAAAQEVMEQSYDPPASMPVDRLIDGAEAMLTEIRQRFSPAFNTRGTAGELAAGLIDKVYRIQSGEEQRMGVKTGIPDLDRDTGGFQPGTLWIVAGRPGMGKAQPLGSPILTPSGWTTMGEIAVGDAVVDPLGTVARVQSLHPQGRLQTYRVRFHDGREVLCCGDQPLAGMASALERMAGCPASLSSSLLRRHAFLCSTSQREFRNRRTTDPPLHAWGAARRRFLPSKRGYVLHSGCRNRPRFKRSVSFRVRH